MSDALGHFPPTENRVPYKLRKLISESNKGSANDTLEAAAFAIERLLPHPVTFNDLEKLMRSAIETYRGLEVAAAKVPGLIQQVADLTTQRDAAIKAAGLAKDAQALAETALALAKANSIPDQDVQDGNTLLDQLQQPAAGAGTVVDPAKIPGANATDINDPNKDL
jgi:hypothetical protein